MRTATQARDNVRWASTPVPPALWEDLSTLDLGRPGSLREA
ncbi:hypothetical protein ACFQ29_38245 [Longispora fulva]